MVYMIRLAQKQAQKSIFRRARMGAVVAKGERILSQGCNEIRYNKYIKRLYPESVHAEQAAIAKLLASRKLHDLIGATIYVCRIGRNGLPRLAHPCITCDNLIRAVGIKRVVFTTHAGTSHYDV